MEQCSVLGATTVAMAKLQLKNVTAQESCLRGWADETIIFLRTINIKLVYQRVLYSLKQICTKWKEWQWLWVWQHKSMKNTVMKFKIMHTTTDKVNLVLVWFGVGDLHHMFLTCLQILRCHRDQCFSSEELFFIEPAIKWGQHNTKYYKKCFDFKQHHQQNSPKL